MRAHGHGPGGRKAETTPGEGGGGTPGQEESRTAWVCEVVRNSGH